MKRKSLEKRCGRLVLVTGASGGIGKDIAIRFAREGWDVVAHYSSSDKKANDLKAAIEKLGARCTLIRADFASGGQLKRFVDRVSELGVDCLVNNAASPVVSKHYSGLTIREASDSLMINAVAPMLLASRVFRRMVKNRFGRIVNISSIAAKYGGSSRSMHYGCSKRALEGITKTLAREGAERNVLVNTVRPGVIDTEFYKKFPKDMKRRVALIPMKKMGDPKDVAGMVYYLGSEKNSFITNEVITIAGGE